MNGGFGPSSLPLWSLLPSALPVYRHMHRAGDAPPGLEELHRLELEFVRLSEGQAGFLYATFLRGVTYYVFVDHWRTSDLEQAEWHLRGLSDKVRRGERPWEQPAV